MDFSYFVEEIRHLWVHLVTGLILCADVFAAAHAVMFKRDSRSAIGWVGIIWLAPLVGAVLYVLLGINRIKRRAGRLRDDATPGGRAISNQVCSNEALEQALSPRATQLVSLSRLVGDLTERPLLMGNSVEPLRTGDEA